MYSPKIREDLIPYLYRLSRHLGQPMTKTVDSILARAIFHFKETGIFSEIEVEEKAVRELTNYFRKVIDDRKKKTAEVIELLRKIA